MKKPLLAALSIFVVLIVGVVTFVFYLILSRPSDVLDRLEKSNSPNEYFTAKEAYDVLRPTISTWNSDAVVTGISGRPWHGREGVYLSPDGRMSFWSFTACSTAAKYWVRAVLIRGSIGVGWGEKPGGERQGPCQAVPIELIVDTADVIKTARNRVDGLEPNEYSLGDCDPNNWSESLCWNVIFEISDRQTVNILLDAYSGEIVNIFPGINKGENLGKDWKLE